MRQHFRIRLRNELVSPLRQHFAKLNIILDDTVMYHSNGFRLIKMRESISIFENLERTMFQGFSKEDFKKMGELLDRMYKNMEDYLQKK